MAPLTFKFSGRPVYTRHTPLLNHAVLASAVLQKRPVTAGATGNTAGDNSAQSNGKYVDVSWGERSVPSYLQSTMDLDWSEDHSEGPEAGELLWQAIRKEVQSDAASEPMLSSFLYASVLAHNSFERALAFVLANRLANATLLSTQLFETFYSVLTSDDSVRNGAIADVVAFRERDPSCRSYSQALLYYKGYHAIQAQRIAHCLWNRGQKVMALALQSRISEVLAVDIHPAARLGRGILLDHGTGVVIGETVVIGDNVSLLQNVTLGGTGKETGDRHPKIADNVLIGACATILGNIQIGKGAQIAAGSLVLKPVPPHMLVAGSPAKEVGQVVGNPARNMIHWSKRLLAEAGETSAQVQAAGSTSSSSSLLSTVDFTTSTSGADRGTTSVQSSVVPKPKSLASNGSANGSSKKAGTTSKSATVNTAHDGHAAPRKPSKASGNKGTSTPGTGSTSSPNGKHSRNKKDDPPDSTLYII